MNVSIIKDYLNKQKLSILLLILGLAVGAYLNSESFKCNKNILSHINPDLVCSDRITIQKYSYTKLKHQLNDFINQELNDKVVSNVSIYFRDLQNGPILGINEHELFSPASLLKLPLLLTYYNLRDKSDNNLFNKTIVVDDSSYVLTQNIPPSQYAKPGQEYTIKQLLDYMIKYSDNNAYFALLDYIERSYPDEDLLKETYTDLGILDPRSITDNVVSVKLYGSIFTQLYNSSYLNKKESSEEILNILSQVDYKDGLIAGVPKGTVVAHKFGERTNIKGSLDQLHDCGIVYYPNNPYLLCVMTRGDDFTKLPGVIESISSMVYKEFDSRKI